MTAGILMFQISMWSYDRGAYGVNGRVMIMMEHEGVLRTVSQNSIQIIETVGNSSRALRHRAPIGFGHFFVLGARETPLVPPAN